MNYTNPIIPGFHPDPSLCRVGRDYYLVTSSFQYFPGIPVFHSRDLAHWEQLGHVLTRESQLPLRGANSTGGIYAPTIRYHDGTFWVIVTNVSHGGNFMVSARDPRGPWSEPIYIEQGGIDPSLFFDDDGRVYYAGTHAAPGEPQGIGVFEIALPEGRRLTETRVVWHGSGGRCPEGPHVYKIGGRYYLLAAEGGTEYGHGVTIAVSDSIWGPYESCPFNPILTQNRLMSVDTDIQGTGHAELFEDHRGNWWMVFLGYRLSELYFHHLGRETFLAPVTWTDGWPVVNGGAPILGQMSGPLPEPRLFEANPVRDDFSKGIGSAWNWIRNPAPERYRAEGTGIRLIGGGDSLSAGETPTFLGRRQEQFDARCAAMLEPENGEAGLSVYYNEEHHYDFCLCDGEILLRKRVGDIESVSFRAPWQGACELQIVADRHRYIFSYGRPGEGKNAAGSGLTRLVSTEATPISFTGVYLGMYAAKRGSAYFAWFDYENLNG